MCRGSKPVWVLTAQWLIITRVSYLIISGVNVSLSSSSSSDNRRYVPLLSNVCVCVCVCVWLLMGGSHHMFFSHYSFNSVLMDAQPYTLLMQEMQCVFESLGALTSGLCECYSSIAEHSSCSPIQGMLGYQEWTGWRKRREKELLKLHCVTLLVYSWLKTLSSFKNICAH